MTSEDRFTRAAQKNYATHSFIQVVRFGAESDGIQMEPDETLEVCKDCGVHSIDAIWVNCNAWVNIIESHKALHCFWEGYSIRARVDGKPGLMKRYDTRCKRCGMELGFTRVQSKDHLIKIVDIFANYRQAEIIEKCSIKAMKRALL